MARSLTIIGAAFALSLAAGSAQAQNTQVGVLNCDVSGGLGLIVTSQREMLCTFTNSRGEAELYAGNIRRFGIDLGATSGGQLVWSVFAPSGIVTRGALAGSYTGASAEATVGAGLGANVLIGGSERSVALQPLSVQGQAGLNVAVGVANLELRSARPVN
ncbi:MAG TPA: DUF992 domain-containing protein [Beijerinckiaceae bacterium]|jgi:hypothetical protein